MTNVKSLYAEITQAKKEELNRVAQEAKQTGGLREEDRIFNTFRRRAREDFGQ